MSPSTLPGNHALREIVRDLKPGFEIEPDGKAHFKLLQGGELVRDEQGRPVTLPGSPSSQRSITNVRKKLEKLGALKNGKQVSKTKVRDEQLQIERSEAELRGETKIKNTEALRGRLDPLLTKTGQVRPTDLARVASYVNPEWSIDSAVTTTSFYLAGKALHEGEIERLLPLVERLEGAESPRAEWFMLLRETLGLDQPELREGKEWPFSVKLIPLEKVFAHMAEDGGYQRPVVENFVRDLALRFDERLVGTIDVSERRDGRYAVIDGLQRSEAMRRVGKTSCYASVYEGLDLKQEATLFFHKNKDRRPVHPYYEFMARVTAEDPVALDIKRIVEQAELEIAVQGGAGLPQYHGTRDRNVTAVRAVEDVYAYDTEVRAECLSPTLGVITRNWIGRRDSLSVNLIRGLGRIFRVWSDEEIQWQHWEEQLAALGPTLVLSMGQDRTSGHTLQIGCSLALVEIHNRGLARGQRLEERLVRSFSRPPVAQYRR